MAKPLIGIGVEVIDGVTYINGVRCDGTETEPVEIPCGCGDSPPGTEPPEPPTVPDAQTCTIANNLAMLAYNASKYLYDQCDSQPDNWFGNLVISSNFRSAFTESATDQGAVHTYMMTHRAALLDMGYDLGPSTLSNIQVQFVCMAYRALQFASGQVTQVWKDRFLSLLDLEESGVMGTEEAWDAVRALIQIMPLSGWQYYSTILSSTTIDPEELGITDLIDLSCGECNPFGGIECEDFPIDAYFHNSGTDTGFETYGGLASDLPADLFQNLPHGDIIQTVRTARAFEAPAACLSGNLSVCRSAGVMRSFPEPITLCSMQMLAKIYIVAPPGETTHSANSSRIAMFYKTSGNPSWQFLAGKIFPLNNGQVRYVRWANVAIENVTHVLAVHWSGGSWAAIDRVLINVPLDIAD